MARPAEPGRRALLEAGLALLDADDGPGLARLSVNGIVGTAGMSKGAFYQHFPDRATFLRLLHDAFHDQLAAEVGAALLGREPGGERLAAGVATFLDACLRERGTKQLLMAARADAGVGPDVARRSTDFADLAEPDIAALGWDPPRPVALLFVAMAGEIAMEELRAGRPRPELRAALLTLVAPPESSPPPAGVGRTARVP